MPSDREAFAALHESVVAGSRLRDSHDHGERRWRAVAYAGLQLLPETPTADPEIVLLFALFHDARRENEFHDPEHGFRGAELARSLGFTSETLYVACRDHTDSGPVGDPTIGVCFDADSLNLWRVGIEPGTRYLSTALAPGLITAARQWHESAPPWTSLVTDFQEL